MLSTAGANRHFYLEDWPYEDRLSRKMLWQLGKEMEGEGTGDQAENMFQHLGLYQASAHRDTCNSGLQLEMLKGHFACETQDNKQKEGLE